MDGTKQHKYVHDAGLVLILESPPEVVLLFGLSPQFMLDEKSKMVLSRYQMFPAQIGAGKTPSEAEQSLQRVFKSYVESYGLQNGLPALLAKLEEHGFRPAHIEPDWTDFPPTKTVEVRLPVAA